MIRPSLVTCALVTEMAAVPLRPPPGPVAEITPVAVLFTVTSPPKMAAVWSLPAAPWPVTVMVPELVMLATPVVKVPAP